jgi:DNA-binding MarR family transcriptional regulator
MNKELELVEAMDKLSELTREFQNQLITGDLKEYTLRQLYYIELINKNQDISVSELSKILNVKKSTVSVAINQLIDLGIVIKNQSKTDKRFYQLKLTPKGKNIINKHMQIHKNTIKNMIEILNTEEIENFIQIVKKITK